MRIAVDAMGSDSAPEAEVRGAVEASLITDSEIILVGDEAILNPALEAYRKQGKISVVHASQAITMEDSPMVAVRKKKDSSLLVGLRLVKEGKADGLVSAGNTGAVTLGSRVILGPIPGVGRSAICQVLPTAKNPAVILDLGANVDCSAVHMCEFAEMGLIFSQLTLGVENPRVGLLNIGEEQAKGNEVARLVHQNLSAAKHVNFIGNIEPTALYAGEADVVVCDGFVGNVILKTSEAVASFMKTLIQREWRSTWTSRLGALFSIGAFKRLRSKIDPNEYPGGHLLGVNGIVIILHGSTQAHGVTNAILGARYEFELELNKHIAQGIEKLRASVPVLRPTRDAS